MAERVGAKARKNELSLYVVRLYLFVAFITITAFGLAHAFLWHQTLLGALELGGSTAMALNWLGFVATKNVRLSCLLLLTIVGALLMVMLATGGTSGTGIYWFFVFPVMAFFLTNKYEGILWVLALTMVTLIIMVFAHFSMGRIAYPPSTVGGMLITLLVVSIGIYVYEESREQFAQQAGVAGHELRLEKTRAEAILQNIREGIVTVDADGRVTSVNPTAEAMLGWTWGELAGKDFTELVPMYDSKGEIVPAERRPIRLAKSGKLMDITASYQRKDGSTLPVVASGTPITIDGKLVGAVGTFRDITQEQEIDKEKSQFVTLVSHQLRTPLSAVSWFSEMLLHEDAGKLSAEQQDYVEKIQQSNQRMAALVGEMLIVSGLELRSLRVIPQATDLVRLTKDVLKEQRSFYFDRKQHIAEQYDKSLPNISLDKEIMRTMLRNVMSNALKYTPSDGTITITVKRTDDRLSRQSAGSVLISVEDTGYGVPEADKSKLFRKFFRAENVRKKDTDGTGLGLYIVKSLAEYTGGTVGLISEENTGTTVTLMLPLEGMGDQWKASKERRDS